MPYEVEPNGRGTLLSASAFDTTISGQSSSKGDEDNFAFRVESPGLLSLDFQTIKRSDGIPNYSVTIINQNGDVLAGATAFGDLPLKAQISTAGWYYVRVNPYAYSTGAEYSFSASFSSQGPTYSVVSNQPSVNEGSTATFTVTTTNVTSGTTLAYTLSGVSASDITGGSLSGTTTVGSNGQATISVPIAADQSTEGNETLTLTLQGKSASTNINDSSVRTAPSTDFRDVAVLQDKDGHFLFTANKTESQIMQQYGWSVATGLKPFESADNENGVTLHKFYYPPTNSFYYATDDQAKAVKAAFTGWDYQGATDLKVYTNAQYSAGSTPQGSVPIYQMWINGKGHVYTSDTALVDRLMGQDINTNILTANNVVTAVGTYNGVVFWGDPIG